MDQPNFERRVWLAVDTVGYGKLSQPEKYRAQTTLRHVLDDAARRSKLHSDRWDTQPGGDGQISAIPGDDLVTVVDDFVRHLVRLLDNDNANLKPGAHLRLRLAIDEGPYQRAPNGWGQHAPVSVARLVDSRPLRDLLSRTPDADLAMIVSDRVYRDVVDSATTSLNPKDFSRVEAQGKEGEDVTPAWVCVPGRPTPPPVPPPTGRARRRRLVLAGALMTVAAVAAGIAAGFGLFDGSGPGTPTAHVTVGRGPYVNQQTAQATISTSRALHESGTRRLRLTIASWKHQSEVLCVAHTVVSITESTDQASSRLLQVRNGAVFEVPVPAGRTTVHFGVGVATDSNCQLDIRFDDITSAK